MFDIIVTYILPIALVAFIVKRAFFPKKKTCHCTHVQDMMDCKKPCSWFYKPPKDNDETFLG